MHSQPGLPVNNKQTQAVEPKLDIIIASLGKKMGTICYRVSTISNLININIIIKLH